MVIVDTNRAHSYINECTTCMLGLTVSVACDGEHGCFWGPGGLLISYLGAIAGPGEIQFIGDIKPAILELKVIQNAKPLVILRADLMTLREASGWNFKYIGIHARYASSTRVHK